MYRFSKKFSFSYIFQSFTAILSTVFLASLSTMAVSQTSDAEPEQQIFVAPLTSTDATILEDLDQTIVSICETAAADGSTLSDACEKMLTQIITSYGDSIASKNAAATRIQNQTAEFSTTNQTHIANTLEMQLNHGRYLFWLAVLVVLLGVLASAFQFLKVWKQDVVSQTEISISEKQLSIKTSWIGVVLLGMSMAFFALYLWFIYRITPL